MQLTIEVKTLEGYTDIAKGSLEINLTDHGFKYNSIESAIQQVVNNVIAKTNEIKAPKELSFDTKGVADSTPPNFIPADPNNF